MSGYTKNLLIQMYRCINDFFYLVLFVHIIHRFNLDYHDGRSLFYSEKVHRLTFVCILVNSIVIGVQLSLETYRVCSLRCQLYTITRRFVPENNVDSSMVILIVLFKCLGTTVNTISLLLTIFFVEMRIFATIEEMPFHGVIDCTLMVSYYAMLYGCALQATGYGIKALNDCLLDLSRQVQGDKVRRDKARSVSEEVRLDNQIQLSNLLSSLPKLMHKFSKVPKLMISILLNIFVILSVVIHYIVFYQYTRDRYLDYHWDRFVAVFLNIVALMLLAKSVYFTYNQAKMTNRIIENKALKNALKAHFLSLPPLDDDSDNISLNYFLQMLLGAMQIYFAFKLKKHDSPDQQSPPSTVEFPDEYDQNDLQIKILLQ